ncbi:MAG: ATP-binding cassette domain-containing protein [Gemmataceae bacterium]|nr:ATP-binding cassette domain-containing protein [Gemmataceae bacterium]
MADVSEELVAFESVSVRFGRQEVLRDISFRIRRGETVVIIGESGCGKTVTLKLIVGLLKPTLGRVTFDGRVLTDLREQELARERLRIGFLFQGAALFDSLSVLDNVAFGMRAIGIPEEDIAGRVRQHLREVGLPETVESKMPAELSGGMRKRVGLARALALNPELMLYDEPTTGLDPVMSDVINELIIQARQRSPMTSVVVTHDMHTVRRVADRVIMLYPLARLRPTEPQIIFEGSPKQLSLCSDPRVKSFVEGDARSQSDWVADWSVGLETIGPPNSSERELSQYRKPRERTAED